MKYQFMAFISNFFARAQLFLLSFSLFSFTLVLSPFPSSFFNHFFFFIILFYKIFDSIFYTQQVSTVYSFVENNSLNLKIRRKWFIPARILLANPLTSEFSLHIWHGIKVSEKNGREDNEQLFFAGEEK